MALHGDINATASVLKARKDGLGGLGLGCAKRQFQNSLRMYLEAYLEAISIPFKDGLGAGRRLGLGPCQMAPSKPCKDSSFETSQRRTWRPIGGVKRLG